MFVSRISRIALVALAFVALSSPASAAPNFKGKSPADYYKSLISKTFSKTWSNVLSGDHDVAGTKLRVSVKLYLFPGNRYLGVYWQGRKVPSRSGGQGFADTIEKFVQGTWSVSGQKLVLSGFATAIANGRGVDITLARDFGTVSMRSRQIVLRDVGTSAGHEVMRRVLRRNNIRPQF